MKYLTLVTMVWLSVAMAVEAQYTYITNNGTITITGYTGFGGPLVIPSTINGLPVTSIGTKAFQSTTRFLQSVTFLDSVTNIGDGAFYNVQFLGSVTFGQGLENIGAGAFAFTDINTPTIPNGVTSIGDGAFLGCQFISSVTISSNVSNIGSNPFGGCPLHSINVDSNNPVYTNVAGVLFDKAQTLLIGEPEFSTNYLIPNTVTRIGANAFYYTQVQNLAIPDGVASIGSNAFANCYFLTNASIPESVTNMGVGPFVGDYLLKTINVDANNTAYAGVGGVLFDKNQTTILSFTGGLSAFTIPATVTSIADQAFEGSLLLNKVILPNSVTNLGQDAFASCQSLWGVYFEDDQPAGDMTVFSGDPGATIYYLPAASGWGSSYGSRPTALWKPTIQGSGM